jgi:hypothetical protein
MGDIFVRVETYGLHQSGQTNRASTWAPFLIAYFISLTSIPEQFYALLPLTSSSDLTRKNSLLGTNGCTRRLLICSRRLRFTLYLLLAESRQEDMDGVRLDLDEMRNPALHSNNDLGGAHFQGSECPDDIRAVNGR